jgi:hypothetical protein
MRPLRHPSCFGNSMTAPDTARFLALLFVALALAPSGAHLLELPNKIGLSREQYFVVQQIYRGWALLGFVVAGELLSVGALMFMVRGRPPEFTPVLAAFVCIIAAQVLFWTLTFPANQATANWTTVPDDWQALRARWEYSHAAAALLNLIAFCALLVSVLRARIPLEVP